MNRAEPWPDPTYWTDEQRRRAEALCLARLIFPASIMPEDLLPAARWITTGTGWQSD